MKDEEKSYRVKKTYFWLIISICFICLTIITATFAIFVGEKYYFGTFDVDISTKGVDMLELNSGDDIEISIDENNFLPELGHDVESKTNLDIYFNTTKKESTYCYKMNVVLPDTQVFEYTDGKCSLNGYEDENSCTDSLGVWTPYDTPEIVLSVGYSDDNENFTNVIENMDITDKIGNINIPTTINGENFIHEIKTTKKVEIQKYWQGIITFVWHKNANQEINNNKTYEAKFNVNIVDCETGEKITSVDI